MDVIQNIKDGKYNNNLPLTSLKDSRDGAGLFDYDAFMASRQARRVEGKRLIEKFKHDVLEQLGIVNHPKADKLFDLAWDYGHASGLGEMLMYAEELVELIQ